MLISSGKNNNTIKEQLSLLAEPAYRDFASSLLPGTENILGVRLPALRKLAKKLAKENWLQNLNLCTQDSFEEIMLRGFLIGYAKAPLPVILDQITQFLPRINNWSVCDSFCITLKIAAQYPSEFWDFFQPLLNSQAEFTLRFVLVMLLDYYINDEYIDSLFPLFDRITHQGYYVKMALAWAISMCYVRFPAQTTLYLQNNRLDDFTYNKSLQKITESHSVSAESKKIIRSMKRNWRRIKVCPFSQPKL